MEIASLCTYDLVKVPTDEKKEDRIKGYLNEDDFVLKSKET